MTQKHTRLPALQVMLGLMTAATFAYTIITFKTDGWNFFAAMQEHLSSLLWRGQFTLDFSCYLVLSALWVMWRDRWSATAIVIGLAASVLGIIVFAPYVMYRIAREKGDLRRVLVGDR